VSNPFGETTSAVVRVAVFQPRPEERVLIADGQTQLGFTISTGDSNCPPTYRWLHNTTNTIAGQTNAILGLAGVSTSDAGTYSVIASSCFTSITSVVSTVYIAPRVQARMSSVGGGLEFHFPALSNSVRGCDHRWLRV
jgi:hypothetical protein